MEPIQIDVSWIMQVIDMAISYAFVTVLVVVCAGAVCAAASLIITALGDGE